MVRFDRISTAAVLLTWLLLQPPISGGTVLTGAPLGSWMLNGRFATSQECESTRSMNLAALSYGEVTDGTNAREVSTRSVITASRCMSEEALRAALAPATPTPAR